jgi:hypothetical protein
VEFCINGFFIFELKLFGPVQEKIALGPTVLEEPKSFKLSPKQTAPPLVAVGAAGITCVITLVLAEAEVPQPATVT